MRKRKLVRFSKAAAFMLAGALLLSACTDTDSKEPVSGIVEENGDASAENSGDGANDDTKDSNTQAQDDKAAQDDKTSQDGEFEYSGLSELYADNFKIGVALPNMILNNMSQEMKDTIISNFNSITCENEMKPDAILDKKTCQSKLPETYTNPAVKFTSCQRLVNFAIENNMQIRLHTLVWHSQTPNWFFTEDYTDDGELVSREVMLLRMENYIKSVLEYFDENYPGLVYAVDVCNEAFDTGDGDADGVRMVKNKWYETVGDDYYYQAFVFARKYANPEVKLFYNDYGCMDKTATIIRHLQKAKDEGLIDGIGMQSHLDLSSNIANKFKFAVKKFCEEGYEVQITELDIGMSEVNDTNIGHQARKYKVMFSMLKELQERGYNITSVTVWGINDKYTWRAGEAPLLFDAENNPKPAYEGAMLSDKIKAID